MTEKSDQEKLVRDAIQKFLKLSKIDDETILTDLVTESYMLIEMVMELQEDFGVRLFQEDLKDAKTVAQLSAVFAAKMKG